MRRRWLVIPGVVAIVVTGGSGSAFESQQGGTFRVAVPVTVFAAIDPALWSLPVQFDILRPACGTLMAYPNKPFPAGRQLLPDLAEAEPVVSNAGRTYTFTIRKDARFSDGGPVTARAFVRALERVFNPAMQSGVGGDFEDVVGARAVHDGKTTKLVGATAKGRTLTLRLRQAVPDLPVRTAGLCAVPPGLTADPEGAKAPLPSPAPYYVSEYVPGRQVVLERNRFYRGVRPQNVDRIVADLGVDAKSSADKVASGEVDYVWPGPNFIQLVPKLAQRYGVNRSQFFVRPGFSLGVFHLNTSRPLFRNNVKLRQAVNFAVDRGALMRELGAHIATPTDQYLRPAMPAYRNERIYPLSGPDLRRARALADGRTRSGKAVFYTCTETECVGLAQIVAQNLKAIGLDVEIKQFPRLVLFEKLLTPGEPYDIGRIFWNASSVPDPSFLNILFHGRTVGQPGSSNLSYFDSPTYNRLLDRAAALSGPARHKAYGELDVQISRDAAPAIPYAIRNTITFVSARAGCVVLNPGLDLTAVCLK